MNREEIGQWLERGIFGLVLSILIFGPLATGAVRAVDFVVIQGLTTLVGILWLLRLWLGTNQRLLWPPICWAVLAFVGYAIVRYIQAEVEFAARQELLRILVYSFLFFVVVQYMHHQDTTKIVVFALVFLGTAISLYAIYQFATNSPYVWTYVKPAQYMKRASGTYICPNHLAGFLEMILPLGLAYTLVGRYKPLTKVFLGYGSLMILAGIGVSVSRGGWIVTVLSLIVFFLVLLQNRHYRLPAIAFFVLLIGGVMVFLTKADQGSKRFEELFVTGKLEDIRFWLWKPAVQIWQDNFWFGAGPAAFDQRFPQYRPMNVQMRPGRVHNDYLNTLADWGVLGAALVVSAWLLWFYGAFKTWKYVQRSNADLGSKRSNKPAIILGGAVGLLAILLHSIVDFNMHIPANAILAVTLMALVSGYMRFAGDRYWVPSRWYLKLALSCVILLGVGYLGAQFWTRMRELTLLERAQNKGAYSSEAIELWERAWAIEPRNDKTCQELGEAYRKLSWEGNAEYKELANKAMLWFARAMRENPWDYYNSLHYGMCLDWIGRHQEAQRYFTRARQLDPFGYYSAALIGWHYVQVGDYAQAKEYFERSLQLRRWQNPIAEAYLRIVNKKLSEVVGSK